MATRIVILPSVCLLLSIFSLVAVSAEEAYLDYSLPTEVEVVPYEGIRYQTEVPDTLDLVTYADRAINVLTNALAQEWDYELYFNLNVDSNPPVFEMGHGGLLNINPKWAEALPMLRVMTGSQHNINVDGHLIASLVHVTGKDGLCYYPISNRPWAFFEEATRKKGQPYADIFGEGRQLLAYAAWYQHDKNPLWRELAEKKIKCLSAMTLKQDGTSYFRLGRGYTPFDEDRTKGDVIPIGDHDIYPAEKGMTGTPASYIVGFLPQACAIWHRLTKSEESLALGRELAEYLQHHGEIIDPETGRNTMNHLAHLSHSLVSNLAYALATGDEAMATWVQRSFDYQIRERDPHRTGILVSDPTCSCYVADMINVGIMLSRAGKGDYWDEVDGWVRNTLTNLQITEDDTLRLKEMPLVWKQGLPPGSCQLADGAERCLGGWLQSLNPQGRNRANGCCNGNCSRTLYFVWANTLTANNDGLAVNLLMNRASPWADVHSYLPYEGKIVIRTKKPLTNVRIRIPSWTDRDQVKCFVDGVPQEVDRKDAFITLANIRAGADIKVMFPLTVRTIAATYISPDPWPALKSTRYKVTLKGNTVVATQPDVGYPVIRHLKYQRDHAPMKTIDRFVSAEEFVW